MTPTRRYDPITGRWDSPDTDGFRGGDVNLYRYCGNAPTSSVNPTGQDRWVLTNGHWWIIVAVWDPTGTNVVGYQRLEYWPWGYVVTEPTFGTTLGTLLLGLPPNPAGVKFVKPGSGGPADVGCVVGHWKSNAAQDAALLAEWRRIQQQQWDTRVAAVGRYLGYYVGWNCIVRRTFGGATTAERRARNAYCAAAATDAAGNAAGKVLCGRYACFVSRWCSANRTDPTG